MPQMIRRKDKLSQLADKLLGKDKKKSSKKVRSRSQKQLLTEQTY